MGEFFRSRGCLTVAGRIQEKEDGGGSGDRAGARCPSAGPPPGPAEVPGASQSVTWRHSHGSPTPRCSHCVQLRLPGGTGKRDELLSGAPALPRPLNCPSAGTEQPGHTGPGSGLGGENTAASAPAEAEPRGGHAELWRDVGGRLTADSSCWACLSGSLYPRGASKSTCARRKAQ